VPNMTTPLSLRRSDFRRTELNEVVLKERLDGPDCLSGQQQRSVATVQNKDDRAVFDEVFLLRMAEAYRLAKWPPAMHTTPKTLCRMPRCFAHACAYLSTPAMRA
jgi:hypothetical protein